LASAPQTTKDVKSDWRTEITHQGRYWHFRSGSGKDRKYMRGGKIDKLPRERIEEYNRNASKKKRVTNTKHSSGNNAEYIGTLGRDRPEVFDSKH